MGNFSESSSNRVMRPVSGGSELMRGERRQVLEIHRNRCVIGKCRRRHLRAVSSERPKRGRDTAPFSRERPFSILPIIRISILGSNLLVYLDVILLEIAIAMCVVI